MVDKKTKPVKRKRELTREQIRKLVVLCSARERVLSAVRVLGTDEAVTVLRMAILDRKVWDE